MEAANLYGTILDKTDFRNTDLRGINLRGAELTSSDLSSVNLRGAILEGINLSHAKLRGADLRDTNLNNADLSRANLFGINLSRAILDSANLYETNLHAANLRETDLTKVDLRRADMRRADLFSTNMSRLDLSGVELRDANLFCANLSGVDLRGVNLYGVNLSVANLSEANLQNVNLNGINLHNANLSKAKLEGANLTQANLQEANLYRANLSGANLSEGDLNGANFCDADLSGTDLSGVRALNTNFSRAIFTAACLENWNINHTTISTDVICEYVYFKLHQHDRRPRKGMFQPGELAILLQQTVDTIDLIFAEGINWQAFFQSFKNIRKQYAEQELAIQAIERKRGGSFIVRLEVSESADKLAIESDVKRLYENQLKVIEVQYEKQLRLQGQQHSEEIQCLIAAERKEKATLMGVLTTMANNQGPKYDLSNAQFGGGFAETIQGNQQGGIINNYGASTEDITRLITTLRSQAKTFPTDQEDEALDTLDDIESDLAKPKPDQARIGRRLKKLVALAATVGTTASGAATISGDLSNFTTNVIELTETLGIPIEQVQITPTKSP